MPAFDLDRSLERARRRLGEGLPRSSRAPRSDRGVRRISAGAIACVARALSGRERPPLRRVLARVRALCARRGIRPPSRATVYSLMDTLPCPAPRKRDLPAAVQAVLHNLAPGSRVPAHQVAFQCFDRGDAEAVAFAAGLPWLAIHQALRVPGYRDRSRGLAEAVARARGI